MGGESVPRLLFTGLLVMAILLVGFNLAPDSIKSLYTSGSQSNSPSTSQMEMLLNEATFNNPVEGEKSQMGPDATVGQTAAMLAAEILLLDTSVYNVEIPLVIK
jgi:hypothetical protein